MPTVSSLNFMKKSKIIQKRLTIPHLTSSLVLTFLVNPIGAQESARVHFPPLPTQSRPRKKKSARRKTAACPACLPCPVLHGSEGSAWARTWGCPSRT